MDKSDPIKCDVLVIGRGLAGMTAAARAAELGLTTVQAGNSAGFFLHSGLIDLLGVYPLEQKQVLTDPEKGISQLTTDIPSHPYANQPYSTILDSLAFVGRLLEEAGLGYQNNLDQMNQSVLTAAGTFKPSFLIPRTMSGKGKSGFNGKSVLFVGFKGLKGFSAHQMADMVKPVCASATAVTIALPGITGGLTPIQAADRLDNRETVDAVIRSIKEAAPDPVDMIGFPAVCGMEQVSGTLAIMEESLGCPCFEIPGLPPSIPGIRLGKAFEKQLSKKDVKVLNNTRIRFESFQGDHFSMTAVNQNMETPILAKGVVLASGRFQGDGLFAKRGRITETIFDLPVCQPEQRNQWYDLDFFTPSGHAINRTGVETNSIFQPVDARGTPLYDRLFVAGSVLAHNDWMRLKSGSGVACVSAVFAVNQLNEVLKRGNHG